MLQCFVQFTVKFDTEESKYSTEQFWQFFLLSSR